MDIGKGIQRSFNAYVKNFVPLFLAALIVIAVCGFAYAILSWIFVSVLSFGTVFLGAVFSLVPLLVVACIAGPLLAGYISLARKALAGQTVDLSGLTAHLDKLLPLGLVMSIFALFWYAMNIIGAIPILGWLISLAVSLISPALFIIATLGIGFVAEQQMHPLDAVKRAVGCFLTDPVMIWLYALVIGIIASLGFFVSLIPAAILAAIFGAIAGFLGIFLALLFAVPCLALSMPIGLLGATAAYEDLSAAEAKQILVPKQTMQLAGLVLAGLFMLGFVFYVTGWGYRIWTPRTYGLFGRLGNYSVVNRTVSNRAAEKAAEDLLSGLTGGKVKISNKGNQVQIKDHDGGTLSLSAGLPKDFPRDVPVYPGAKVLISVSGGSNDSNGLSVTLTTRDNVNKVYKYYQDKLTGQGWTLKTTIDLGEMRTIAFKKDRREGSVAIVESDKETGITLVINE